MSCSEYVLLLIQLLPLSHQVLAKNLKLTVTASQVCVHVKQTMVHLNTGGICSLRLPSVNFCRLALDNWSFRFHDPELEVKISCCTWKQPQRVPHRMWRLHSAAESEQSQILLQKKLAMSSIEETSVESTEVKEDKEFDVETEEQFKDDYGVDPTRYMFYR